MLIKTLTVGNLGTNCYVVTDEKTLKCAVIDPGAEANTILNYVESNGLTIDAIFLTHGHYDHTMALHAIREENDAPIYIHEKDTYTDGQGDGYKLHIMPGAVEFYKDGDHVDVGSLRFYVIETPGHSPGSVVLMCENALFCGDTLFRGSCGRTDLPGGDTTQLLKSLKRLLKIEENFEVYPGHMESSTLNVERATNYYMKYAQNIPE